jgi:hypothetical protein
MSGNPIASTIYEMVNLFIIVLLTAAAAKHVIMLIKSSWEILEVSLLILISWLIA